VGFETRNSAQETVQNTQAMEIAAYQELINNISEFNALSVTDQETADMMSAMDCN
jgi:hypothetical protein